MHEEHHIDGIPHTVVKTFWANIFVGFRDSAHIVSGDIEKVRHICSKYVNKVGLCVTVTPTDFVYSTSCEIPSYAGEPGAVIGLINYPRFPADVVTIKAKAVELAIILGKELDQHRVTISFPDETVMLGEHD